MFKKSYVYHFKATASTVPNNLFALSYSNELICGIVHKNSVCLFTGIDLSNISYRHIFCENGSNSLSSGIIISIGVIYLHSKPALAILKEDVFYIYETNGSGLLFSVDSMKIDPDHSFCCFAAINSSYIYIGTDNGYFLKFEILSSDVVQFKGCMRAHNSSMICMSADDKWLASADENSTIQFWKSTTESTLDLISKYSPPNNDVLSQPSTMVMLTEKRVCAVGFTNGRLCLFNCETGRLLGEICAHSKIITGLAFKIDVLISVSEDTICRIWRIGSGTDSRGDEKPSASLYLMLSWDGKVRFWDLIAKPLGFIFDQIEFNKEYLCETEMVDTNFPLEIISHVTHALEKVCPSKYQVSLIQSNIVADQMLQGVAFTGRKGMEFVISSYDSNEVHSFIQS